MNLQHRAGVAWGGRQALVAAVAATGVVAAGGAAQAAPAQVADGPRTSVIVRELPGSGSGPQTALADLGGTLGRRITIIDGSKPSPRPPAPSRVA